MVDNIEYEPDSESSSSHYVDDEAMEASNDETSEECIVQNREGMELYGNLFCESETFGIYPYADDASDSTTSDAYDTNASYGEEEGSEDEEFVTDEEFSASSSDEAIHDEIERKEKLRKRKKRKRKERKEKKEKRKDALLDQDLEDLLEDDMNRLSSESHLTKVSKIWLRDSDSSSSDADETEARASGEAKKRTGNDGSAQEKTERINLVGDAVEEDIGETGERLSQIFIDSEEDGSILDEYESDGFIVSDGEEISQLELSEESEIDWSDSETSEERERARRERRKKVSKGRKYSSHPTAEAQPKRNRNALLEDSDSTEEDKKRKRLKRKKDAAVNSNGIQIDIISPNHEAKSARHKERKPKERSIAISLSSDSDSRDESSAVESSSSTSLRGGDVDKENMGGVNAIAISNNNNSSGSGVSFKRAYSNNRLFSPVQNEKPRNQKFKQLMRRKRKCDSMNDSSDSLNSNSTLRSSIADFGMLDDASANSSIPPLKRESPCLGSAGGSRRFTSINLETGETTKSSYCVEAKDGAHPAGDASFSSPTSKQHSPNPSKRLSRFNRSGFVSFVKEIERDQGVDLCSPKRADDDEKERRREQWHRRVVFAHGKDKRRVMPGLTGNRSLDETGNMEESSLESFERNFEKFLMNSQEETRPK